MAPHAIKRKKVAHPSSFESEDGGILDAGSVSSCSGHDATIVQKQSIGASQGSYENSRPQMGMANKFASSVYQSNTFKLQMEEMLLKVRPQYGTRMTKVDNALRKLKTIIESIPDREAVTFQEAERKMRRAYVRIPFPEPQPGSNAKYTLTYTKPININVVGSYSRRTAVNSKESLVIDLAVTMPSSIFQEKDFLDYRYFHKRAYYLACIAAGIQEVNLSLPRQLHIMPPLTDKSSILDATNFVINFAYQDDNFLQPILMIDPDPHGGVDDFTESRCRIRIILAAKEDLFPASKLLPNKVCIRTKNDKTSSLKAPDLPTPLYNGTLKSDCLSLPYLKLLHAASAHSVTFRDACLLGSIWLRQRGYGGSLGNGGFGQFELACMTALLMQSGDAKGRPVLSSSYSSYQLFKAVLQFLSTRDLIVDPLCIQSNGLRLVDAAKPVFFDGLRGHNILFKMTTWSYKMLRHDASTALRVLSQGLTDGFELSFITKIDSPLKRFDAVFKLTIKPSWTPKFTTPDSADTCRKFCQELYNALLNGLGDRVSHVYLISTNTAKWSTALKNEFTQYGSDIVVGLLISSDQVSRTIDKGPSAEDKKAAAAFRNFWGGKAELRRFKDGSILESLIWDNPVPKSSVIQQIIQYVVRRHIEPDVAESIRFLGLDLDQLSPESSLSDSHSISDYRPLMTAFEALEEELRSMEGLPLQMRQISAASSSLRYASLELPMLRAGGFRTIPADFHVQFEGSARWPDDISAVQRIKVAFLLKIEELLEKASTRLGSRLGLENETNKYLNIAFLDILSPDGAYFRIRIHHERELSLLERLLKDKTQDQRQREEIAFAISAYKRNFVQKPLHTQAIRTLSTRFPLLSPLMRLLKRWCNSHLLSPHITDELIELLAVRAFVHPYPYQAPGSLSTAFLRTLTSISKWDWRSDPLIVDFTGEMTTMDVEAINTRFEAWRHIDPGMNRIVMFAASNVDPDGVTWTESGPSKVVAARFTSLAKAACDVVKAHGLEVNAQALFVPSYQEYDFLIHLDLGISRQARGLEKQRPAFRNLELQLVEDTTVATLDPIQLYLDDLCAIHGNNIVLFYNAYHGSVIAGLWNPQTGPRPWRVNLSYSTVPGGGSGDGATISINKTGILNDIARLGGDMVSKVVSIR